MPALKLTDEQKAIRKAEREKVAAPTNVSASDRTALPNYKYIVMNDKFAHKFGTNIALRNHDGKHPLKDASGKIIPVYRLVQHKTRLDINNERDNLIFENAKTQPSHYLDRINDPLYYIEDEAEEAEEFITDYELSVKAGNLLMAMIEKDQEEFISFSRLFAINPDRMTFDRVKSQMYEKCQKNPQEVIDREKDPMREIRETFRKATHRKVIVKESGVFYWNGQLMGATYEEAVKWMVEHEDLIHIILQQADNAVIE